MKFTLISILLCISLYTTAQTKFYKDSEGFNSCFQKLEKGYFIGNVDGLLQFESNDGTKYSDSFSMDTAYLEIIPDANKIYDVSTKRYFVKNSEIEFEYCTYGGSNALFITKGFHKYTLSLIDGACIYIIKGLNYKYVIDGETELLIIHFSDKIGLCSTGCYTSPDFYVLKGSTLIFTIKR